MESQKKCSNNSMRPRFTVDVMHFPWYQKGRRHSIERKCTFPIARSMMLSISA